MIEIVQGGNLAFNAMMFGGPDVALHAHLSNQFNNASVAQNLTDYGRQIYEKSRQMFDRFAGDHAMQYLKAVGRAAVSAWQVDCIKALTDIGQLQWASPTMQRFIMAEPETRRRYHAQRLDGYSHTYIDLYPGDVGEAHYDYRRAMHGLMVMDETEDPNTPEWTATSYADDLVDGDEELTISEQVAIQDTWDAIKRARWGNEDWTDRFNSSLD